MSRHPILILIALTLALAPRAHGQCPLGQFGQVGSGVGAATGFNNTFAVGGFGSQFQVLSEPTSGSASLYASYDIGLEIKKIQTLGGSTSWASDGATFWCFDRINAATNPLRLRSTFSPPGGIRDFILVGLTLYVWQGTTLSVIDYTDTAAPFISATIALPASPTQATFLNNRLYLLTASRTVLILDVTVPANPAFIRSLSLGGTNLTFMSTPTTQPGAGTLVHFAFYQSSIFIGSNIIRIVDIDNDQLTGASGSVQITGSPIQISGAYMLQAQSLLLINWANPLAPTFSTLYTDTSSRFRSAGFVTSAGVTRAFIAGSEGGLLAVNTTTGTLQNRFQTPGGGAAYQGAIAPGTANLYTADGLDGLRTAVVLDFTPNQRGFSANSGISSASALTKAACGDTFVLTSTGSSVPCYSSSSPAFPSLISTYAPASSTINDLAASGASGLILRSVSGIPQLDLVNFVNNPPVLRDSKPITVDPAASLQRVRAFGNLAITITDLDCRLFSFSASSPSTLTPRALITVGAHLRDAAVSGNFLYLLDFDGPIHTLDITNPDAPVLLTSAPGAPAQGGLALSGDWLATVGGSINFVNISNRAAPIAIASALLPNTCSNVAAYAGVNGADFLVSANGCGTRAFAAPSDFAPAITAQPHNTSTCPGGTATFTVGVLAPNTPANPTTYQWFRGASLIPGATGPTLILTGVSAADAAFTYTVAVANSCGSRTSAAATLALCRVDINCSGAVSVQDIFDFLTLYFAESPAADFNGAGGLTVQDLFDFLAAYFVGCA